MPIFSLHNIYEEAEVQRLCYLNSWLKTEPEAGLDAEEKTEAPGWFHPSGLQPRS